MGLKKDLSLKSHCVLNSYQEILAGKGIQFLKEMNRIITFSNFIGGRLTYLMEKS